MKVLVIAPHPDDEILGVGGTIKKRSKKGDEVYVCIVTKGYKPLFDEEVIQMGREEAKIADKMLGVKETFFLDFPAVMLETIPRYEFNEKISEIVQKIQPDEIYIPHRGDMQIDHQMVVDAAMVAVRPKYKHKIKRVYAYETLSETGWNIPNQQNEFIPNVYEDITETLKDKLESMRIFKSQLGEFPEARSIGALDALAKYRGAIVGVKAAEAFILIREIK
ncbi:TPA: PIG-L family deacetylase [Clostridium perfringens]|nr:PIG-L deacetylase family protein [Clostridium perfringens]HBI6224289.1 PIG-L family deacetylase [Clostridium perfringens]HBI7062224.1 PIG-L family deacetylase [Clostridium perfringens]HBI7065294.1 PIG-L family deacetylase [Clostridium perfringens]HBI7068308.1 PIG-L family deacetylase [Clostridium perfringens]